LKIHLNIDSSSTFLNEVDKIGYRGGGTDILAALRAAITEINNYSKHNLTVVGEYPSYRTPTFEGAVCLS
jgi:uncharacterized protein with von Willebrand factor type A (vWA) domain